MYSSQTPIDIHCSKLIDWLVQHRHCKRDWGENLASIRRKIKSAIKDMPESDEIKQLLVGSKLDYIKSKKIVEILKKTEADSKNIFGYYSSQRMKDWQDIVYSYEKDCIYIAEAATDLIRETNYEVPGVRRIIQRLYKDKGDLEKERASRLRRQQQFNSEYQKMAQKYGIKGINVVGELQEQSNSLASVMSEIVDLSKELENGLSFYVDQAKSITKQEPDKFLSTLHYVITKGNTTLYEMKFGEPPLRIEVEERPAPSSSSGGNPSDVELTGDEIDFGEDAPSSSESSSGFVHVSGNEDDAFQQSDKASCDSGDKVARGDDAKAVLENRKTRNQYLNNCYELEAFFKQLCSESQVEWTGNFDKKGASVCLIAIKRIIDIFSKEKNQVIFQMNDSPSFIDSVNEKFSTKSRQALDSLALAEQAQEKIMDVESRIRETELHLKQSIYLAKEMQGKVEDSIRELYKGRQINIMGCVN